MCPNNIGRNNITSLAKISFRYVNDILPIRITNLFDIVDHAYMTRNRNFIRVRRHTLELYTPRAKLLGKCNLLWYFNQKDIDPQCT